MANKPFFSVFRQKALDKYWISELTIRFCDVILNFISWWNVGIFSGQI